MVGEAVAPAHRGRLVGHRWLSPWTQEWLTHVNHMGRLAKEAVRLARGRHPNKHVEVAIRYAESRNWRVVPAGKSAHAWGVLCCPHDNPDCRCGEFCRLSVASTPRSPENHAKMIRRRVDGCIGPAEQEGAVDDE